MTIVRHELRRGLKAFLIWTIAIAFLLAICVFMFPEMSGEMDEMSDMFASMGSFTEAFGMDKLDFGTFIGFYSVECGNILGLGGAFFAALLAVTALAKEEKDRTAEFLLSHPVRRSRIISGKLAAVMIQIAAMNLIVWGISIASVAVIGEVIPWTELTLLHTAALLLQIELAGICFGISAFIRRESMGIGLGIAAMMYFFNIIGNISDSAKFLKYITPFGYADGADIISNLSLDAGLVLLGMAYTLIFIGIAYFRYCTKDIQ